MLFLRRFKRISGCSNRYARASCNSIIGMRRLLRPFGGTPLSIGVQLEVEGVKAHWADLWSGCTTPRTSCGRYIWRDDRVRTGATVNSWKIKVGRPRLRIFLAVFTTLWIQIWITSFINYKKYSKALHIANDNHNDRLQLSGCSVINTHRARR